MADPGEKRVSLLIELADEAGALEQALACFSAAGVNLTHIESRPTRGTQFDFYVDCEGDRNDPGVRQVIDAFRRQGKKLLLLDGAEVPWFPRHIQELDQVAHHTLEAGVSLAADHPGFNDPEYRASRARIDQHAQSYRHGSPLPDIDYTERETGTWQEVYQQLRGLHEAHACAAYIAAVRELEAECGYGSARIPQVSAVDAFLRARTGFRIRPVAGLLASRNFLAGLAFRVFFCTQYIRHYSRPLYTPEPDVCHEFIGHVPMFADAAFADFSQEIGLASLGASDTEIERLARCYWFSVEFGLLRESGKLKAYGAGLLSSSGELVRACASGSESAAELQDWEPEEAAETSHPITDYQDVYFVARSLQDAKARMRAHCRELPRPFYARFNPTTERIWVDRAVRRTTSG